MLKLGYVLLALAASPCCVAQETAPATETVALAQSQDTSSTCCRIADGTAVSIEILEPLSSALVKRGDKFRLRLAETVLVEGKPVLASGIEGVGEIVHAEKSRSGGKAGELLIAARYLETSGTPIPLRALKLGGKGKDNTNAALATSFALGPLALFVHGREIVIPAGTLAQAKIAQELQLPAQPDAQVSEPVAIASESAATADQNPTAVPPIPLLPAEPVPEGTTTRSTTNESTQEPKE
ncbi:hypothetical protein [Pseudoxanthomonas sp. CF125]|uniref:hypothetical protein n=1 Tax=Pseudoxanthomonas sp. CF125 TaxID=1855303 RepID=UPI00088468DC|nr:hypothetical protein [Pseudoxanthomonas sp. CF125]SDQ59394.1 hypothetical protein SAMN05216569_1730 [Pseudoxanthomonas sp. CF125]